ncbi:hypothetical protein [Streptomyces sp. GQFP]|uniref:hypothetical protein n=1 Tax=Streptomyces sp. GQFP TaxID=2907545 RepID=UPI001F29882C|nr:hypothetical protein [Streptomyces sp. GQFP]UIX33565.1 hypothetical protein LUX31_28150 [Streptomyces sp. GQFP]
MPEPADSQSAEVVDLDQHRAPLTPEAQHGRCGRALASGAPCPDHPVSPSAALLAASAGAAEAFTRAIATVGPNGRRAVEETRLTIEFHASSTSPTLHALAAALLDPQPRTADAAYATARTLLAAHTRECARLARARHEETRERWGVNRGTRALLTGMDSIRKALDAHAVDLDPAEAQQ